MTDFRDYQKEVRQLLDNDYAAAAVLFSGKDFAEIIEFYGDFSTLKDLEIEVDEGLRFQNGSEGLMIVATNEFDDPQQFSPDGRRELPACWLWREIKAPTSEMHTPESTVPPTSEASFQKEE